jgi:hypothetical protein
MITNKQTKDEIKVSSSHSVLIIGLVGLASWFAVIVIIWWLL